MSFLRVGREKKKPQLIFVFLYLDSCILVPIHIASKWLDEYRLLANLLAKMRAFFGIVCLMVLAVNLPGGQAVERLKLSSGHEIPAVGLGTSTVCIIIIIYTLYSKFKCV